MVAMDVEADLEEIRQPIPLTPILPENIEQLFTSSSRLKSCGVQFEEAGNKIWQLTYKKRVDRVTFFPEVFNEMPSVRLMSFGEPLFEELLDVFALHLANLGFVWA